MTATFEAYTDVRERIRLSDIVDDFGGSWVKAINAAIATANACGGAIIDFPENQTITMTVIATALGSHITLNIPQSCIIVKANGTYNNIFGLQTPTWPAYIEDVHINGGTWQWITSTDPGGDDGRGPILFKYGDNVSVTDAVFQCLNTAYSRRTSGPYFAWCTNVLVDGCIISDAVNGVTVAAQTAPDNSGRSCSVINIRRNRMIRTVAGTDTNTPGVFVKGTYGSYNVTDIRVTDNMISNHGMGIEVGPGDNARIAHNTIDSYLIGISSADISTCRILDNYLSSSATGRQIGIEVTGSAHANVARNSIIDAGQNTAPGIGVYGSSSSRVSDHSEIKDNYIEGGADGIQLIDNANHCRVVGNTIRSANVGIHTGPTNSTTGANQIYNAIHNNTIDGATSYAINVTTYSSYSATNLAIVNNVFLGDGTINGTVTGSSAQNVTVA